MEIVVDLSPEVVQMLDYHRATYQTDRSSFMNYIIALYDQNTREYHQQQQVQYQQPQQRLAQYDDSGYLGTVEGLEPVETVQRQYKLHRESNVSLSRGLHGNLPSRGTKPQATVIRQKSKTVPKNTARRMM